MAKRIKQFRYYGEGSADNQPSQVTLSSGATEAVSYTKYVNGEVFANFYPIVQLGVQALPGTKFYLNNGLDPIIIGYTGIYELDLDGAIEITKITFDKKSLEFINNSSTAVLIVDIVYDDGKAEVS